MCGICGVVGRVDEQTLVRMRDTMVHRGPDASGIYIDDHVGLAARRLSIIDIEAGMQPIANEDKTVWVVFNGEIYNHRELRRRLESQGHRFATACDTEVLVHLYEEYGDAGVQLLRGMFAYAIWDTRKRRLLLVRDRLGQKPLYYTRAGGSFSFASEAKALFARACVPAAPNLDALDLYLTFQYVPGPTTLFKDIQTLPPGHLLTVEDGRVSIRRYWDTVFGQAERGVDIDEASEEFRQIFSESVRLHMGSDVPVGVLLSGGIDSSAVVGAMAETGGTIRTFTVGFDIPGLHNELADARLVANHFCTEHHEVVVSPDVEDLLPKLLWHLDEPIADTAALPTFLLCQFAHQYVRVVLTGEGGDELLGGYPRYSWFVIAKRLERTLPASARRALLATLSRLPVNRRRQKALLNVLGEADDAARHVRWIGNFDSALKAQVISPDLLARADRVDPVQLARTYLGDGSSASGDQADLIHRLIGLDVHTWLADDILAKVDKMSMAASVEARTPFLDHQLIEFMSALPVAIKVRTLGSKRLLRKAMASVIPRHTLTRRKHAFLVPVDEWLRGPLHRFAADVLLSPTTRERGWLQVPAVEQMLRQHVAGDGVYGQPLWNLLCLELWARAFFDRQPVAIAS